MSEFHGNSLRKGWMKNTSQWWSSQSSSCCPWSPQMRRRISNKFKTFYDLREKQISPNSWHPQLGDSLVMISLDSDNMTWHTLFHWKRKITRVRLAKPILSRKQLNYHKICIFLFLCTIIFLIWSVSGSILIMVPSQSNQIKLRGPRKQNANVLSRNEHFSWGRKTTNLN